MTKEFRKALRAVFRAGMINERLHPDDNSYDEANFSVAANKETLFL